MKHVWRIVFFVLVGLLTGRGAAGAERLAVVLSAEASPLEQYAAGELRRYVHAVTGTLPQVEVAGKTLAGSAFVVGRIGHHPLIDRLIGEGKLAVTATQPGPQGYALKKLTLDGREALVIAAQDEAGVLYGVYGLLEDHFGLSFHLDGDVLPSTPPAFYLPDVDEVRTPSMATRGILPWTNFPQSPSSYSWEDWTFVLDQMAKMRMNFLLIHNYNFDGHNEMFHNFQVGDRLSRGWFPTARSGHCWGGMPGWDVNRYLFGAADLFDDYDFGADSALHNQNLDNRQIFRKGVVTFQRLLDYAHRRGIKVALGLDLDVISHCYGLVPNDPKVIAARAGQIARDYPQLDYLTCFFAEGEDPVRRAKWRGIFDGIYAYLKANAPQIKVTVSGWGLPPHDVASLPADVACTPISFYSAKFDPGAAYGQRDYWGCPWMERDFVSSEYYYPYNYHLADTIRAWQARSPNMKGLFCLTWRLADAVAPKIWFIARAPWDTKGELKDAETVYRLFAQRHYGAKAAPAIATILNNNEPVTSDWGECGPTRPFKITGKWDVLMNLKVIRFRGPGVKDLEIPAISYQDQRGVKIETAGGEKFVGDISHNDFLAYGYYPRITLDPKWDRIEFVLASGRGGRIELRTLAREEDSFVVDQPGPKIGEVEVPPTGGLDQWKTVECKFRNPRGGLTLFLVFRNRSAEEQNLKAEQQLRTIDQCIAEAETPEQKYRLGLLRCRIAAARDHNLLNLQFPNLQRFDQLPGPMASWVGNFLGRVNDISSLGNVVSVQNRYVRKNYLGKEAELRRELSSCPPDDVQARGTRQGRASLGAMWNRRLAALSCTETDRRSRPNPCHPRQGNLRMCSVVRRITRFRRCGGTIRKRPSLWPLPARRGRPTRPRRGSWSSHRRPPLQPASRSGSRPACWTTGFMNFSGRRCSTASGVKRSGRLCRWPGG